MSYMVIIYGDPQVIWVIKYCWWKEPALRWVKKDVVKKNCVACFNFNLRPTDQNPKTVSLLTHKTKKSWCEYLKPENIWYFSI